MPAEEKAFESKYSSLGHILFRPTLRRNNSFTNISKYPKLIHIDNLPQKLWRIAHCTERQKDRQTDKQPDRQTDRQTDMQSSLGLWCKADVEKNTRWSFMRVNALLSEPSSVRVANCIATGDASPFLFLFLWCQMLKTIASPSERCGDLFKTLVFSSKNLGDL